MSTEIKDKDGNLLWSPNDFGKYSDEKVKFFNEMFKSLLQDSTIKVVQTGNDQGGFVTSTQLTEILSSYVASSALEEYIKNYVAASILNSGTRDAIVSEMGYDKSLDNPYTSGLSDQNSIGNIVRKLWIATIGYVYGEAGEQLDSNSLGAKIKNLEENLGNSNNNLDAFLNTWFSTDGELRTDGYTNRGSKPYGPIVFKNEAVAWGVLINKLNSMNLDGINLDSDIFKDKTKSILDNLTTYIKSKTSIDDTNRSINSTYSSEKVETLLGAINKKTVDIGNITVPDGLNLDKGKNNEELINNLLVIIKSQNETISNLEDRITALENGSGS